MKHILRVISSTERQLWASAWIRSLLAGAAAGILVQALAPGKVGSIVAGLGGFVLSSILLGAWKRQRPRTLRMLHHLLDDAEYSLDLVEKQTLTVADRLQMERLAERMAHTPAPQVWHRQLTPFLLALAGALLLFLGREHLKGVKEETQEKTGFTPATEQKKMPVTLSDSRVQIRPPRYTGQNEQQRRDLHISAVAGSVLTWRLRFSHPENLKVTLVNTRGEERTFAPGDGVFEYTDRLLTSGLYAFRAYREDSLLYQSEYYRLEAIPDAPPRIEPASRELYRFHFLEDSETLRVDARVSDDFQVKEVYLVATLARGSGENVRFREMKFPVSKGGFRSANLQKTIRLNELGFTPGDELYYYWAALDNKSPEPNFSKSDTYFLVYKDTAALRESELATLAVNILPEYFRSQRQIIIDTEKLLARKGKTGKNEFNAASNEIGFDQKALRIRYGQYLGEEYESSIGGGAHTDSDDPLEGFMHKHDSEEEGHHDHDHGHDHGPPAQSEETDPLKALLELYVHSHDDAESNTFYEQSTRSILKTALENMWQSELHLRLYTPEKALPYQYKALELLKEVQQKSRVYIAKTAYDPPPIKEAELRMKGELKKFNPTFRSEVELARKNTGLLAAKVMGYLEADRPLSPAQKQETVLLSGEVSRTLADRDPSKWEILASLQKMLNDRPLSMPEKSALKAVLLRLGGRPASAEPPGGTGEKTLEKAFWKNLF